MKKLFVKTLREIIKIVAKIIGNLRMPFSKKRVTYDRLLAAKKDMQPGDIILTRTYGEATTLLIPGYWKHTAIYIGEDEIVHANSHGVIYDYLADLLLHTDEFMVLRAKNIPEDMGDSIAAYVQSFIGVEYDFGLELDDPTTMYCSELAYRAINDRVVDFLVPNKVWGIETFSPDDFSDLVHKDFELIHLYSKRRDYA